MASGRASDLHLDLSEGAALLNIASEPPSAGVHSEPCDTISPQTVTKRVVSGELVLKINKKSKGNHAWNQFCLVWDPVKNEQVRDVACCSVCKSCLLYKRMANGEEKSLGTKNMLDHLKNCTPSSCSDSSIASGSGSSVAGGSDSSCASKVVKRVPGMKTLDSFVKCTGKKVGEQTKMLIRKWTATLVAAAQLPYCFIEQESLKDFAQAFVDLGAGYGRVPASDLIAGRKTDRRDIVKDVWPDTR